jgi:hypothetical protein
LNISLLLAAVQAALTLDLAAVLAATETLFPASCLEEVHRQKPPRMLFQHLDIQLLSAAVQALLLIQMVALVQYRL